MKNSKRFFCMLLTALMILTLAACGKDNGTTKTANADQTAQQSTTTDKSKDDAGSEANGAQSGYKLTVPAKLTGKLNLIELDDRDPSVLRGIKTLGNCVGSEEGINGKDPSLDDVRCIFTLNEWVEFYPDTDKESGIRVWILKHRDDHEYYADCKFSDLMPDFATYCDLHYPEDADDPLEWYWGNFYLFGEEQEAGYYDFVFTYDGKAIATLVTRFYNEGELDGKSDSELETLMHE